MALAGTANAGRLEHFSRAVHSGARGSGPVVTLALLFAVGSASVLIHVGVGLREIAVLLGPGGNTALVAVLASTAFGAALVARRAGRLRRPIRLFAILQAVVGLHGLTLPLLSRGVGSLWVVLVPGEVTRHRQV